MSNITKKQKNVFDYIRQFSDQKGYAPSLEEIRKHFKLASVSTSHHYVKKLQDAGYLEKESNQPRSINVSSENFIESPFSHMIGYDSVSVPIVGSANCGPAEIIAEENIEGYLKVSKKLLLKKDGIFVLRASGNSMNKSNIHGKTIEDGDFVIIDSTDRNANNDDYVLSIIDGKANLKKFKIDRGGQKMLIAESTKTYKPFFLHDEDDFMINGKIINVIKK